MALRKYPPGEMAYKPALAFRKAHTLQKFFFHTLQNRLIIMLIDLKAERARLELMLKRR